MIKKCLPLLLIVAITCFAVSSFATGLSITFGVSSGDWNNTGSWVGGVVPGSGDTAIFDGTGGGGFSTVTVTNIPTTSVAAIKVINGCTTLMSCGAAVTVTDNGGAGALQVTVGSVLKYYGSFALTIALPTGSNGTCDGDIIFTSTGAAIPHRLTAVDTSSLVFTSGATFQFAPGGGTAGNPFGTGINAPISFLSGSTCYQGGTKTGPSVGTGSGIIGAGAPNQTVWWAPGSVYWNYTSVYSWAGRVWGGDFIDDNRGVNTAITGTAGGGSIWGTFRVKSTAVGQIINNVSGNTLMGNMIVESGAAMFSSNTTLTVYGTLSAAGPVALGQTVTLSTTTSGGLTLVNYSGTQNVYFGLSSTPLNLTVNNLSGINLLSNATCTTINMIAGNINTNGNTLILGTGASATGTFSRTAGTIIGNFKRWIATSATAYTFPVGSASAYAEAAVDFTAGAPSVGGTLNAIYNTTDPGGSINILDGSVQLVDIAPDGWWTISSGDGLTGGTYAITLQANGIGNLPGDITQARIVKRVTSGPGAWSNDGTIGSNSGVAINRTAIATGFSDFGIAGPSGTVPVELSNFSLME